MTHTFSLSFSPGNGDCSLFDIRFFSLKASFVVMGTRCRATAGREHETTSCHDHVRLGQVGNSFILPFLSDSSRDRVVMAMPKQGAQHEILYSDKRKILTLTLRIGKCFVNINRLIYRSGPVKSNTCFSIMIFHWLFKSDRQVFFFVSSSLS